MKSLEEFLRDRLTDSRAVVAALDINADRVLLRFGAIGRLPRITLRIVDNVVSVQEPSELAAEWRREDKARRGAADNAVVLPIDQPVTAVLDGERLFVGEGGPELVLPEAFFDILAAEVAAAEGGGADGDGATGGETGSAEGEGAGSTETPAGDSDKPVAIDPEAHTKEALLAIAAAEGVEAKGTKAEIAAAINAKRGVAA